MLHSKQIFFKRAVMQTHVSYSTTAVFQNGGISTATGIMPSCDTKCKPNCSIGHIIQCREGTPSTDLQHPAYHQILVNFYQSNTPCEVGLGLPQRTRCFFIFFRAGTSLVLMIPLGAGGRGGGLGAVRRWGEGRRVRGCEEVGRREEG